MPEQNEFNSEQMMLGFRQGNEASLSVLFRSLCPALCYYASKITGDPAAAEDIAGESFLKIWNRRQDFQTFVSLKSYLYTIVRNACFDWIRKNKTEAGMLVGAAALLENAEASCLEHLIAAEAYHQLYDAIDTLPVQCRTIIRLSYLEGKSGKEVAAALHIDHTTVRTQKHRGIMLLRKRLRYFLPFE